MAPWCPSLSAHSITETRVKMAFTMCSPAPPNSRVTSCLCGGGLELVQSPGSRAGGGEAQPWDCTVGSFLTPLSPKEARGECFHFRVLESSWALWHLEELPPPISCPIRMGWGEDLALAVGEVMAPQAPGHSQKGGVSPGQTPIWDQVLKGRGEGQGGQGSSAECSLDEVVGWTIRAGTRRQAQPDWGEGPSGHHSAVMHCSRCLKKSMRCLAT